MNRENYVYIPDPADDRGRMIKPEHKETGAVALSVYLRYLSACSITLCVISLIFQLVYHSILVTANYWLTLWSIAVQTAASHAHNETLSNTLNYSSLSDSQVIFLQNYLNAVCFL